MFILFVQGHTVQSAMIDVECEAVRHNLAKRSLAKLCLNSKWVKWTGRNNRAKSKTISDPHERYRFLATPGIEFANPMFASDDVL